MAEISVVLSTRDRPGLVSNAVRSILGSTHQKFQLVVVDQSTSNQTHLRLSQFQDDLRLHFVGSAAPGLSHGRNAGVSASTGELIAFTDDDCEVPEDWLAGIERAFSEMGRVGIVFGKVLAPENRPPGMFSSSYLFQGRSVARSIQEKHRIEGIGACMAIRRSTWADLGGFDPLLGAGARFRSAEETDLAIRALLAGIPVGQDPGFSVIHHCFRARQDLEENIRGHLYGLGAMLAKHVLCTPLSILPLLFHLGLRWAFAEPAVDFGFVPSRRTRLAAFGFGFSRGLRTPLDRCRTVFRDSSFDGQIKSEQPKVPPR